MVFCTIEEHMCLQAVYNVSTAQYSILFRNILRIKFHHRCQNPLCLYAFQIKLFHCFLA